MIGIQNNHYRAEGVWDRRYALPAAMTLSNRGSFLNLPASRFHHGCRDTFLTAFNSDLILRGSRSRTVTRRSNFVAVDGMVLPLPRKEYIKWEPEESRSQRGGGLGKLGEVPERRALAPDSVSSPVSVSTSHPYFWAPFILVGEGKRSLLR